MTSTLRVVAAGVAFATLLTLAIALTAGQLTHFEIVGPGAPFEYPWRLAQVDDMARVTAWLGYALHNLITWGLIWFARRRGEGFSNRFRGINWIMLAVHLGFGALHIVQTQIWYDGLARDVPEVTALGSVALMLMVVLMLETPRRGLAFGWKAPFSKRLKAVLRDTHGYLFSWALIYTFWYHPTEGTQGHLVGFFYMFLLLWQSVLLYHRAHLNRKWTLFLELLVLPHGAIVAWHQGQGMWPMFAFGFGAVFVLTQVYGLGLSTLTRRITQGALVLGTLAVYIGLDRLADVHEVTRIPVLDYGVVFLLWGLFVLWERLTPRRAEAA